jgi:chromosome segregation ATPase
MEQLTEEQLKIVQQYQQIHKRLTLLEDQMKTLSAETEQLMGQLTSLREKDKKLFNNYGKEE